VQKPGLFLIVYCEKYYTLFLLNQVIFFVSIYTHHTDAMSRMQSYGADFFFIGIDFGTTYVTHWSELTNFDIS
jgi:hypothetical protein